MKIHAGVMRMFETIEPYLTEQLISHPPSAKPKYITFCGHSLGGALATLCAAYYANLSNKNAKVSCHTFGAPKIGDSVFYQWFNNAVEEKLHLINENDLISYLPPSIMGYKDAFDSAVFITDEDFKSLNLCQSHDLDTYIDFIRKSTETAKIPQRGT
jgi:triacylglycerol lipase